MREVIDFIVKETLEKEKEKPKMIINDNNNKAEKRKKPAKDYLQKQLDMISDQKKKKEELYLETLAKLTAKYDKETE
jgi:hypothetical protein